MFTHTQHTHRMNNLDNDIWQCGKEIWLKNENWVVEINNLFIWWYVLPLQIFGSTCGVRVIVIGSGLGYPSSNPEWGCLHIA